jgi:hypothetical protein
LISNQQYALKIVAKSTLVKPKSKQKVPRSFNEHLPDIGLLEESAAIEL